MQQEQQTATPRYYVETDASYQWRDGEMRAVRYVIQLGGTPRLVCAEYQTVEGWRRVEDVDLLEDLLDRLEADAVFDGLRDAARGDAAIVDGTKLALAMPHWAS